MGAKLTRYYKVTDQGIDWSEIPKKYVLLKTQNFSFASSNFYVINIVLLNIYIISNIYNIYTISATVPGRMEGHGVECQNA